MTQVLGTAGVVGTYGNLGGGGNAISEAGNEIIAAFSSGKGPGTKFDDLQKDHFDRLRETIFRYVIFGHHTNARVASNDCTTGVANRTRRQFLVTLGGVGDDGKPCWGTDAGGNSVGFSFQRVEAAAQPSHLAPRGLQLMLERVPLARLIRAQLLQVLPRPAQLRLAVDRIAAVRAARREDLPDRVAPRLTGRLMGPGRHVRSPVCRRPGR